MRDEVSSSSREKTRKNEKKTHSTSPSSSWNDSSSRRTQLPPQFLWRSCRRLLRASASAMIASSLSSRVRVDYGAGGGDHPRFVS